MYKYTYEVPVSLNIPKDTLDEKMARILQAYDKGDSWRIRTAIKMGCNTKVEPSIGSIKLRVQQEWSKATDIDVWTGDAFWWGR